MNNADISKTSMNYIPTPVKLSFWESLSWPFSLSAKARYRLRRAWLAPTDAKRRGKLIEVLRSLQQNPASSENVAISADIVVFLASVALEAGHLYELARWLSELEDTADLDSRRVALRCCLMDALIVAGKLQEYAQQAEVLFGDPLLSWEKHAAFLLKTVRTLYEQVSQDACAKALAKLKSSIKHISPLKNAQLVCLGKGSFASIDSARKWANAFADGINSLNYSPKIYADAFLCLAKVDEWEGRWNRMAFHTGQACSTMPGYLDAQYWVLRAALYLPDVRAECPDPRVAQSLAWDRLRLLHTLHQTPSLNNAEAILDSLKTNVDPLDSPEKLLAARLIHQALASTDMLIDGHTVEWAKVCEGVCLVLGRFAWADIGVAKRLIRIDRKYREALDALEAKAMDEAETAILARIARLMLGIPSAPKGGAVLSDLLSLLEQAFLLVFSFYEPDSRPDPVLLAWLDGLQSEDNLLLKQFPDLEDLAKVLGVACRAMASPLSLPPTTKQDIRNCAVAEMSPPWLHWLLSRLMLLACDAETHVPAIDKTAASLRFCAWEMSRWATNQARVFATFDLVENEAGLTHGDRRLALILTARSCRYRAMVGVSPVEGGPLFPELGPLCDSICEDEAVLELDFAAARFDLASGNADAAMAGFGRLEDALESAAPFTKAWWLPTLGYWRAVAMAHAGKLEESARLLEGLTDGFKVEDARAQLALLALRNNELGPAWRWLEGLRDDLPATAYSKALAYERQGLMGEAQALLNKADVFEGTAYALPASRLVAAIAERSGEWQEAEERHRGLLASHPGDSVSSARLGRLLSRKSYIADDCDAETAGQIEGLLDAGGQAATWIKGCQWLVRLSTASEAKLADLQANCPDDSEAGRVRFCKLLARRYLAIQNPRQALAVIDALDSADLNPTKQVIAVWDVLGQIGARACASRPERENRAEADGLRDKLPRKLSKLAAQMGDGTQSLHWRSLAEWAFNLSSGQAADRALVASEQAWIFWAVPGLLDESEDRRRQSAQRLKQYLASDRLGGWSELQRTALDALASWAIGEEEAFLKGYASLENRLAELPVDGREFWFASASIRFRQHQWSALTEGELPPCVEDLAYPKARLIIGLAYARAAADAKDTRQADALVRQAREMLSSLTNHDE